MPPLTDVPSSPLDRAKPVRAGEELDLGKLEPFLRAHVPAIAAHDGPIELLQFPSGHSNLTYLVRAGAHEFVLRRPPFGSKVKSAHDMGREHRILGKLAPAWSKAPRPVAADESGEVIGAPFYVMERIAGVILRKTPPAGVTLDEATCAALSRSFVDGLAELHALDFRAIGLGDLGKPEGYVERQVTGWTKRYHDSKTDDIAAVDTIAAWLAARIPKESGAALIHNDWKYDNLVLEPSNLPRIIGVLDWEMSTLGDPLMDLGTALSYWVEAGDSDEERFFAFGPTYLPGSWTRARIAEEYGKATGRDVSNIVFYYCFALFKTAVVAQQIYYRYKHGLTKDERFAAMIHGVRILSEVAVRAAARGHL
jgi:aminoglycoside phosphotransferase (APT) family kinase protein